MSSAKGIYLVCIICKHSARPQTRGCKREKVFGERRAVDNISNELVLAEGIGVKQDPIRHPFAGADYVLPFAPNQPDVSDVVPVSPVGKSLYNLVVAFDNSVGLSRMLLNVAG